MADIAATDFTETVQDRWIEGKKRHARVLLTLSATAALSYPATGGIPLPTTMGMHRNIDYVHIIEDINAPSSGGILWKYFATLHAVRGYWGQGATSTANAAPTHFAELPTTWNPSETTLSPQFLMVAVGW